MKRSTISKALRQHSSRISRKTVSKFSQNMLSKIAPVQLPALRLQSPTFSIHNRTCLEHNSNISIQNQHFYRQLDLHCEDERGQHDKKDDVTTERCVITLSKRVRDKKREEERIEKRRQEVRNVWWD